MPLQPSLSPPCILRRCRSGGRLGEMLWSRPRSSSTWSFPQLPPSKTDHNTPDHIWCAAVSMRVLPLVVEESDEQVDMLTGLRW